MQCCYITYLSEVEGGIECFSPDANIITFGKSAVEAVTLMRNKLEQWLGNIATNSDTPPKCDYKSHDKNIKGVKAIIDIEIADNVIVDDTKYVRKNVTLAAWLNREAEKRGISFSKELQDALIDELGLQDIEK